MLPSEVEKKFSDIDFARYDISIPFSPPTPQASPVQAVPMFSSTLPVSPTVSGGGDVSNAAEAELDPLFSYDKLLGE